MVRSDPVCWSVGHTSLLTFPVLDEVEEPKQVSMDWNSPRKVLTSNMTLHWSDEEDEGEVKGRIL